MWASISHMTKFVKKVSKYLLTFLIAVIVSSRLNITFVMSPTGGKFKATFSLPVAPRFAISIAIPLELMVYSSIWLLGWLRDLFLDNQ